MTSTAHALVAGAIATSIQNPVLAAPLALLSHFILDSIPHWDFGTNWRSRPKKITGILAIGETLFGIGLSYYYFGQSTYWVLCVVMSLLPDWLEVPWYVFFAHHKKTEPSKHAGILEKFAFAFYKLPNAFHAKAQLPLGIITQIATVAFFIFLLG